METDDDVNLFVAGIRARHTAQADGTFETGDKNPKRILCSDDACPCSGTDNLLIGSTAYLYISQEVVDFRKDCLSLMERDIKLQRMTHTLRRIGSDAVVVHAGVANPLYLCETGARRRGLDLGVALADGVTVAETGFAPLRPTPRHTTRNTSLTEPVAKQPRESDTPVLRVSVRSMKGSVSKVGSKYRFQVRVEGDNKSNCGLGWSGVTINVPTINSRERYSATEIQMSSVGCSAPFQHGPGDIILGFRDDGSFGEKAATCLFMESVREQWPAHEPIALEAVLLVPQSILGFHVRVWSNRPENDGAFGDPDWKTVVQKDQQGISAYALSLEYGLWNKVKDSFRRLRFALLIVAVAAIGTAGKLMIDRVAESKLIAAREKTHAPVSADSHILDIWTAQLEADRQTVARLAAAAVPPKREMYVDRPIHAGDTFAGLVGNNGVIGGPFNMRTVPDAEAAAKSAADRARAAVKLAEDEASHKQAVDMLAKDKAEAARLAKASVRWQDAFAMP